VVNPTSMQGVESMLRQIRQYQDQAAQGVKLQANELATNESSGQNGFANSIKGALQEVNSMQQVSKVNRTAYEKGESIPLTEVVMSMQKSSLAFEATLQIRNKVLKAYEDIMNMPV
jgi:flagellar hook-basal body complex protein FliE